MAFTRELIVKDNFNLVESNLSTLRNCDGEKDFNYFDKSSYHNSTGQTPLLKDSFGNINKVPDTTSSKINLTPEQIEMGVQTAGSIALAVLNRQKSALKIACGRKPLFGNQKKAIYRQCVANFNAPALPPTDYSKLDTGLSPAAMWGIGIGATVVFGLGIFAIIKMKSPKAAPIIIAE